MSAALILIDVINDFDFPEAEQLLPQAVVMAKAIKLLKGRAKLAGLPVIYVNDNFGRWRSDFRAQIEHCLAGQGREIVATLKPEHDDYFVLKPMHSGFYSTSLDVLLRHHEDQDVESLPVLPQISVCYSPATMRICGLQNCRPRRLCRRQSS